jgi:hypothetical protein
MISDRRHIYAAALVGVVILSGVSLLPPVRVLDRPEFRDGDTRHYEDVAKRIDAGLVPYRDFYLEYPPAAIPVFMAPRVDGGHYQKHFRVLMWLLAGAAIAVMAFVLAATGASRLRLYGGTVLVGLAPIPLLSLFYDLYDVWPALIALAALAAVLSGRPRLAAGAVGLGTAAKIYPIVLLPLILVYGRRRLKARDVRDGLAAFVVPIVLSALPFIVLNPPFGGLAGTASVQFRRPLQIESLGGSFLLVADRLGLYHAHVTGSAGSQNLAGGVGATVAVLQSLLLLAALIVVWLLFVRGSRDPAALGTAAATAVVAFASFGKVLSPQYLIWLVFAVPLATRRVWVPAVAAGAIALVLTRLYFPFRYDEVVDVGPLSWIVLARNLTLVLLFFVLLAAMRRDARRSSFRS